MTTSVTTVVSPVKPQHTGRAPTPNSTVQATSSLVEKLQVALKTPLKNSSQVELCRQIMEFQTTLAAAHEKLNAVHATQSPDPQFNKLMTRMLGRTKKLEDQARSLYRLEEIEQRESLRSQLATDLSIILRGIELYRGRLTEQFTQERDSVNQLSSPRAKLTLTE